MSPTTPAPFIVFSLPRSRSAWLSVLLGHHADKPVTHDLGAEGRPAQAFLQALGSQFAGTCETGAQFAWRLIRARRPDLKLAVVLRDPEEVADSLERLGLNDYRDEMWRRAEELHRLTAVDGVHVVHYAGLARQEACAALVEHCLGRAMDPDVWAHLDRLNIQVDLPKRLAQLAANRARIEALKREASHD